MIDDKYQASKSMQMYIYKNGQQIGPLVYAAGVLAIILFVTAGGFAGILGFSRYRFEKQRIKKDQPPELIISAEEFMQKQKNQTLVTYDGKVIQVSGKVYESSTSSIKFVTETGSLYATFDQQNEDIKKLYVMKYGDKVVLKCRGKNDSIDELTLQHCLLVASPNP